MSKVLGSWIEITIPNQRMLDLAVSEALGNCVKVIGGATVTQGGGFYIREDNGQLDREQVSIVRWDFSDRDARTVLGCTDAVVTALLSAGEECVLRRRFYEQESPFFGGDGYKSELIFA